MIETPPGSAVKAGGRDDNGVESAYRATSPLLRSDFAQSTAGQAPNGDLHGQFRP